MQIATDSATAGRQRSPDALIQARDRLHILLVLCRQGRPATRHEVKIDIHA